MPEAFARGDDDEVAVRRAEAMVVDCVAASRAADVEERLAGDRWQAVAEGAAAVRRDPIGFARIQWETWSPPGWLDDAEFAATAAAFADPDWASVTLNAYRSRWVSEASDRRYGALQERLATIETLATPTLMIQGRADMCDEPQSSEGQQQLFTAGYRRLLLDGIGFHCARRRAPSRTPFWRICSRPHDPGTGALSSAPRHPTRRRLR
jgi:hypothetical protein